MCWSFEISLITGLVSWFTTMYLIHRRKPGDFQNAIFLATFSTIQFIDAWFWYDNVVYGLESCSVTNQRLTRYALPTVLSAELFVSQWGRKPEVVLPQWWNYATVLTSLVMFGILYDRCTVVSPRSDMLWWGSKKIPWFMTIVFAYLLMKPRFNLKRVCLNRILFLAVLLLRFLEPESFGSYWCAVSNLLAFAYLF